MFLKSLISVILIVVTLVLCASDATITVNGITWTYQYDDEYPHDAHVKGYWYAYDSISNRAAIPKKLQEHSPYHQILMDTHLFL